MVAQSQVPPAAALPALSRAVRPDVDGQPQLIVSDLDGTLLNRAVMSERTRAAIEAVQDAGIRFILATGRTVGLLGPAQNAGFAGIAICDNGAVTYDMGRDQIIACQLIEADLVGELAAAFHARNPEILLGVSRISPTPSTMCSEPRLIEYHSFGQEPIEVDRMGDEPAGKIFAISRSLDSAQIAQQFADITRDRVTATWSNLGSGLLEITAAGVNKESAARSVARRWRIDAIDVVAMGDGNNDLELLAWAGTAVVPANGSSAAKMLANVHVDSIIDDGTARYLEDLVRESARNRS